MATWHQQRAQTRLFHDTLWTVVEDPPNDTRCLTTFQTRAEAEAWRDHMRALYPDWRIYVLRPANDRATGKEK